MSLHSKLDVRTYTATAALAAYVRVKLVAGEVVAADETEAGIGVTEANVLAGGLVSVRLFSSTGSAFFRAAGAFAQHAVVRAAADGEVDDAGTGPIIGYAAQAASGDQHVVEVLLAGRIAIPVADGLTALTFTAIGATGPEVEALRDELITILTGAGLIA